MNNYAIKKENSLLILNIIFSLLKNESDLIDVIFFYNKIIKGEKNIVYFNHDLYGSDLIYVKNIILFLFFDYFYLKKNCLKLI